MPGDSDSGKKQKHLCKIVNFGLETPAKYTDICSM